MCVMVDALVDGQEGRSIEVTEYTAVILYVLCALEPCCKNLRPGLQCFSEVPVHFYWNNFEETRLQGKKGALDF